MAVLMFRCPTTKSGFASGFMAEKEDLLRVSTHATLRMRCKSCNDIHNLRIAEAWLDTIKVSPN